MSENKTGRAVSQDDWKRTQVRMPQEQYEALMSYAEKNNLSLNTAMLELMDLGLKSKEEGKSGRSIYFNDLNCVEDVRQIPLVKQQENLTAKISQLFSENPQYQLINIETLNNGEKIRYWYSIPRSESFRD
ncbi:hypothetical protein KAM398_26560 [Acinetobacter sp. KAM398]|uniref:hypothetical protein n=1 Tax=unclassified Acinetobacter TaxID=196816 RepID=UPI001F456E0C|nr:MULTISPECIES: hypothetical protein [unclassified Acinetobacter]GJC32653.1 hypothetical protein KAM392_26320 [Acinetobacter sp. KAM392]GJC35473.1 hypothetical protein KAM393_26420 [Acinetobacter sp. KAM393]GJC38287.1 hypothetical protein KAM394_26270 [Acinetobacter sp. KAM394]GJC41111.1 hypothetical protein KAM395_26320 [Acinetobacter sp. KAM395]GJC43911.1 hypothetical protein KAM396_26080 [Acinetobacter sp. KAM396]